MGETDAEKLMSRIRAELENHNATVRQIQIEGTATEAKLSAALEICDAFPKRAAALVDELQAVEARLRSLTAQLRDSWNGSIDIAARLRNLHGIYNVDRPMTSQEHLENELTLARQQFGAVAPPRH